MWCTWLFPPSGDAVALMSTDNAASPGKAVWRSCDSAALWMEFRWPPFCFYQTWQSNAGPPFLICQRKDDGHLQLEVTLRVVVLLFICR